MKITQKTTVCTLRGSVASLRDGRKALSERLMHFLEAFARNEDGTVHTTRNFLAEVLFGVPYTKADLNSIRKAELRLTEKGRLKVDVQGWKGPNYFLVYRIIPLDNGSVDGIPDDLLERLNAFSKYKEYQRPSEYVHQKGEVQANGFRVPDIDVMTILAKSEIKTLFKPSQATRSTWNTIGKQLGDDQVQVFIDTLGLYYSSHRQWKLPSKGAQKIKKPGAWLNYHAQRFVDAISKERVEEDYPHLVPFINQLDEASTSDTSKLADLIFDND